MKKSHVAPISFNMKFSTYVTVIIMMMCGDNIDDKEEEEKA